LGRNNYKRVEGGTINRKGKNKRKRQWCKRGQEKKGKAEEKAGVKGNGYVA
jgi:hypothetical protein